MALNDAQRMEIRRHLGYPMIGSPAASSGQQPYGTLGTGGGMLSFRYFEYYALLEARIGNAIGGMSQHEEVAILGNQSASFTSYYSSASAKITVGGAVVSGDSITAQINGVSIAYTLTGTDTLASTATGLASGINASAILGPVVIATASGPVVTVTAKIIGARANSLSILCFNGASITGSVTTTGGSPVATTTLVGGVDPPGPRWIDPSETVVQPFFGYLPIIQFHEQQVPLAVSGMDTIAADVFKQRQDELAARYGAYQLWCKRLAQFIGVPYRGAGNYDGMGPRRRIV